MKLGLGTVQFGLDYGVANRAGQVPPSEVARMLALAEKEGISVLDTAHHYGDSQRVLGQQLRPGAAFRIVTKTPRFGEVPLREAHADLLEASLASSLRELGRQRIYGSLVHHAPDAMVEGSERLFARLTRLKERGWVEKIGVSVYRPEDLESILHTHPIDLVQLPFNVLDQRMARRPDLLQSLRQRGVEVHVRSAFLQGLLLLDPAALDPSFGPWLPTLTEFRRRATAPELSPLAVAVRFALEAPFVDTVIVGACSTGQLTEIVEAARGTTALPALDDLAVADEALINPSRWLAVRP